MDMYNKNEHNERLEDQYTSYGVLLLAPNIDWWVQCVCRYSSVEDNNPSANGAYKS